MNKSPLEQTFVHIRGQIEHHDLLARAFREDAMRFQAKADEQGKHAERWAAELKKLRDALATLGEPEPE